MFALISTFHFYKIASLKVSASEKEPAFEKEQVSVSVF